MSELLSRLSARELTYWMAYSELEPFGSKVEDWRTARLLAMVHNRTIYSDKESPRRPVDFMPGESHSSPDVIQMDLEETKAFVRGLAGGKG